MKDAPREASLLHPGAWLGVDVGSKRDKVATLCLVTADERGHVTVDFERGPARDPYPETNQRVMVDPDRPPTYLAAEIEGEVARLLLGSALVKAWLAMDVPASGVAIDAPVAFALDGAKHRRTEERAAGHKTAQAFTTPPREAFVADLRDRKLAYLRVNNIWKCVGLAAYRTLATAIAGTAVDDLAEVADGTAAPPPGPPRRLRECFPSDVYARATGREGVLAEAPRRVLRSLLSAAATWHGRDVAHPPTAKTRNRIDEVHGSIALDLRSKTRPLSDMRKHKYTLGDLWDAFTCAFVACCDDHGAAVLRGDSDDPQARDRLRREGAILTVRIA